MGQLKGHDLAQAARRHGRRADADAHGREGRLVAGGGVLVAGNVDLLKDGLNTHLDPALAQALRVQGIPAVKAVWQGQLVAEFSGAIPEEQARQFVTELVRATTGGAVPGEAADLPADLTGRIVLRVVAPGEEFSALALASAQRGAVAFIGTRVDGTYPVRCPRSRPP